MALPPPFFKMRRFKPGLVVEEPYTARFHWSHLIWSVDVPTYQYRCSECGKSFERTETISEHEAAQIRCPKCNSKKVTQVPGRVNVVTSKKS